MTAAKTKEAQGTRTADKARTEPPYNVVLHNDFHNPINRVVWRLWRTIPGMTIKRATRVTWEAHSKGRAIVATCHRELAELYEERLKEKGLTATVEPAR